MSDTPVKVTTIRTDSDTIHDFTVLARMKFDGRSSFTIAIEEAMRDWVRKQCEDDDVASVLDAVRALRRKGDDEV